MITVFKSENDYRDAVYDEFPNIRGVSPNKEQCLGYGALPRVLRKVAEEILKYGCRNEALIEETRRQLLNIETIGGVVWNKDIWKEKQYENRSL